ncbi:murein DD-endopeptidase MepM/ murein hydrolase activator NlpD [Stackebrandtia albiflava]|uniref:Murein DD-endopeptidase MepM/ murein hydrolase activator NlpD n=1 Tax=Stackebrandtia albiflava TaxID=406432 RepID=A0A562V1N0_9ACTN|nr:M23 family metallopeptidase [Stackebrandtia albiflava]TWJ11707.1 murein DD-endopeptidase MepM/ murein hydrolase activator NlpD [Stackebrandtia albiflava]
MDAAEPTAPGRARRRLWWGIAGGLLALLCCGSVTVYVVALTLTPENGSPVNLAGCGVDGEVEIDGPLPQVRNLSQEQMENAAIIVQVGQDEGVPPRGWIIAVATAMQESTLHNYGHLGDRNDHDSQGLFQQRPSQGWGTVEQITDPVYASRSFYRSLLKVASWEGMDLTVAAQAVQRSAYPDAYAKWEPLATDVVNVLTDGGARSAANGGELGQCTALGEITASGWTAPVPQGIVSGYRTAQRPDHYGVDLGSPRGTEVRAAAGGVVITAECNAFAPDGSAYSCDVDGSPSIAGCGWFVNIQHADGIQTRYCHFETAPLVQVGQRVAAGEVIGVSGTSGNSSGPHLHFEVHTGNDQSNQGAIDPVAWLAQQGVAIDG